MKAESSKHPNHLIAEELFREALDVMKKRLQDGECRMSFSQSDWEAKLPPLKHNPQFPWIGQAVVEKEEEIKPVVVEVKVPVRKELELVGAGKQLAMF